MDVNHLQIFSRRHLCVAQEAMRQVEEEREKHMRAAEEERQQLQLRQQQAQREQEEALRAQMEREEEQRRLRLMQGRHHLSFWSSEETRLHFLIVLF